MKTNRNLSGLIALIAVSAALSAAVPVQAAGLLGWGAPASGQASGQPLGGQASLEVGFSPEGSAAQLVDRAIDSAHSSIRLAGYSFTSPDVVKRLIAAKRRGVDVAVVVDEKNNVREDRSGKARAALNLLVNAGIPTRTISVYPIHHDKYMVIDGQTVETGSFNYSEAAARRNSENALLIGHVPTLAKAYLDHWQSRWQQGVPWQSTY